MLPVLCNWLLAERFFFWSGDIDVVDVSCRCDFEAGMRSVFPERRVPR